VLVIVITDLGFCAPADIAARASKAKLIAIRITFTSPARVIGLPDPQVDLTRDQLGAAEVDQGEDQIFTGGKIAGDVDHDFSGGAG
jgi:hypothetical protein